MKVKILNLQTAPKLQVIKVIKELTNQGLRETKDQVDAAVASRKDSMEFETLCHEQHIKQAFDYCGLNYCFSDKCPQYEEAEPKLQKEKMLQEVTSDDLGVSIHSINEMLIGWQCKMLFTHEQATRVISSLRDAKLNVTETHVMYDGNKTIMLVIAKNFPNGTTQKALHNFEYLLHRFIENLCRIIEVDRMWKDLKEDVAKAFKELDEYE